MVRIIFFLIINGLMVINACTFDKTELPEKPSHNHCDTLPKAHTILVKNNFFEPGQLQVVVGDTIKWKWVEGEHTSTSLNIPVGAVSWDCYLDQDTTFHYIITVEGVYNYHCLPHTPSMAGTVTAVKRSC